MASCLFHTTHGFDLLRERLATIPRTPMGPNDNRDESHFLTPYIEYGKKSKSRQPRT